MLAKQQLIDRQAYQLDTMQEYQARDDALRQFKHDFEKKMLVIKGYADSNAREKEQALLKEMAADYAKIVPEIDTGHPGLDALLNAKLAEARRKTIRVEKNIALADYLPINEMDLCSILGNALDNAIEGCLRVADDERWIEIILIQRIKKGQAQSLYCRIDNAAMAPPTGKPLQTSKSDKRNHGFGIRSIRETLRKYDSAPHIQWEERIFSLSFVICEKLSADGEQQ